LIVEIVNFVFVRNIEESNGLTFSRIRWLCSGTIDAFQEVIWVLVWIRRWPSAMDDGDQINDDRFQRAMYEYIYVHGQSQIRFQ
jgi:hypothetical protein